MKPGNELYEHWLAEQVSTSQCEGRVLPADPEQMLAIREEMARAALAKAMPEDAAPVSGERKVA